MLELLNNILFSYFIVCIKLVGESHFRTTVTVYKCMYMLDWISPFSILVHTYDLLLLYLLSLLEVAFKCQGQLGGLKYRTFVFLLICNKHISKHRGFMLIFRQNRIRKKGRFSLYFHFSESRPFMTSSHELHHKQTKIMFHVTKFTFSDRI